MKHASQIQRLGVTAVVTGLLLGLLAFFLIPVMASGSAAKEAVEAPVPRVLAAAAATALPPLDPAAPAPVAAMLAAKLDPILSSSPADASVSASVIDVASGEELYSHAGDQPGIPASSLKVFTAIAATQVIGEEHRFTTKAVLRDPNTVVLVGGGDVLLGAGTGSEAASGRAGLETLARLAATALLDAHAAGETGDAVSVQLDDSLFAGPALNPDWDASLVTTNNISPLSPIAMYGARANANPKAERVGDPGMFAATTFAKALRAAVGSSAGGPQVATEVTRAAAGAQGTELAAVTSATLGEQIRFMLEVSDNYVAEALGRLVAVKLGQPGDYAHGAAAVAQVLADLGIDTTGMELKDTSGLADTNRVAPLALARALGYAATSEHASLRNLGYALPVAGATGTLSTRLGAADTRGMVRAKTGSLMEVSSLSGLTVTRDGRALAFSFFVNTNDRAVGPHRQILDASAAVLTGCGCR
ncbi:D-alanyl-D-alanine carboxypeptidase/D-alanyl-D-alanine-endopeptidase [Paeniglutamicibacter sp.]|uniref:D-alanyl-D-alanine carboxypeptidase/D-alanyl-D-alanine endopeptidase n=1 Tax=Paeniglutamicibacter sp. TaxID=1934391 RepID=UPI003989EE6C